jgi:hypothetical protein
LRLPSITGNGSEDEMDDSIMRELEDAGIDSSGRN